MQHNWASYIWLNYYAFISKRRTLFLLLVGLSSTWSSAVKNDWSSRGSLKEQKYDLAVKQGRPVFGVDIKIADDNYDTLPNNGKDFGNLWVKGPWVCSGYLNVSKSESHKEDEWFLTGDVASIDEDGFMLITDRVKDVIKSGGEWISSIQVENIAVGHIKVGKLKSKWLLPVFQPLLLPATTTTTTSSSRY